MDRFFCGSHYGCWVGLRPYLEGSLLALRDTRVAMIYGNPCKIISAEVIDALQTDPRDRQRSNQLMTPHHS
jgi:hypothetical protein